MCLYAVKLERTGLAWGLLAVFGRDTGELYGYVTGNSLVIYLEVG